MNPKQTVNRIHPQAREEATEWFVAFCEGEVDASGRESFDRWLRTSPEHVRAYLQISALWEGAGLLVESREINIEELVQRAGSERNVLALSANEMPFKSSSGKKRSFHRRTISTAWQAIAAGLLLVSVIAGGIVWWQLTRTAIYETGAAEQRTVRLPDGSIVQLNARSRIKVHFTTEERGIDLIEGQALFSVAKNPRRAFIVYSDVVRVKAVGTRFDVYRKSGATIVTVVEGQVAVSSALISAGEQAIATARAPMHAYHTNVFAATAWTEGKLMFDSAPLREVMSEFNRIGLRRLVIEDNSLLDLHISGVFPATDPSQLVTFLRERFGVSVTETDQDVRLGSASHK
jgi:transmembrane sensor